MLKVRIFHLINDDDSVRPTRVFFVNMNYVVFRSI